VALVLNNKGLLIILLRLSGQKFGKRPTPKTKWCKILHSD